MNAPAPVGLDFGDRPPGSTPRGPRLFSRNLDGIGGGGEQIVLATSAGNHFDLFFGCGANNYLADELRVWGVVGGMRQILAFGVIRILGMRHICRVSGVACDSFEVEWVNDGAAVLGVPAFIVGIVEDRPDSSSLIDPALGAQDIVPADAGVHEFRGVYVGTGGDIQVDMKGRGTVIYNNVPTGTFMPIQTSRIWAANTTALELLGLE